MHSSKTEDIIFECKDIQIQPDEIVKPLGIHIDNMLKFAQHVTRVIRKCEFQLETLQQHSKLFNTKTKLFIFHSFNQAKLITQPKFQSQTHVSHSLRQDGTRLWDTLPNICKDTKDVNVFNQMIVKYVN